MSRIERDGGAGGMMVRQNVKAGTLLTQTPPRQSPSSTSFPPLHPGPPLQPLRAAPNSARPRGWCGTSSQDTPPIAFLEQND